MEFQIKDKEWAENVIVKRMLEMQDREDTKRFIHEVLIINKFKLPNIVKCKGVCFEP